MQLRAATTLLRRLPPGQGQSLGKEVYVEVVHHGVTQRGSQHPEFSFHRVGNTHGELHASGLIGLRRTEFGHRGGRRLSPVFICSQDFRLTPPGRRVAACMTPPRGAGNPRALFQTNRLILSPVYPINNNEAVMRETESERARRAREAAESEAAFTRKA